ncbi:MAG: cysteine dioxygenase [Pseudonocardiales bacterium]|nr:cysteine dioxygenase [Pseudonocardiales bacterium]
MTAASERVEGPVADEATVIAARPATDGVPARSARPWVELAGAPSPAPFAGLPDRDLDRRELLELVSAVAASPQLWQEHVAYDDQNRHYVSLHRDAHVDVWVLCWTPANDTGWHDHDISSGAVAVVEGCLTEHNLSLAQPSLATDVAAGAAYAFGPDHIHRLTGRDAGSVSIHAYSPPLWRMGQYAVSPSGMLHRTSVSYADELRPLDDMI